MVFPRVYADFQNLDDDNRLKLNTAGTRHDLARQGIDLQEGTMLTFYSDDADDQGRADEIRVEGTVRFNQEEQCWVAEIDWSAIRHASDETAQNSQQFVDGDIGSHPTSSMTRRTR